MNLFGQRVKQLFNPIEEDQYGKLPARVSRYRTVQALQEVDSVLLWLPLMLMLFGLVMVYSASIALPDSPKYTNYWRYGFVVRQMMGMIMGLVAAFLLFKSVSTERWRQFAPVLFIIAVVLLILVLIPHVGVRVNGARRWLPLGIMNFQPSEMMKLAVSLYAADYSVRKYMDLRQGWSRGLIPFASIFLLIALLLMLEPDMGSLVVITAITMGVMFLAGMNYKVFLVAILTMLVGFVAMIVFTPFRAKRLFAYLNPWDADHAQNGSYQLTQSLIAFGRGEIFGQGLGNSVQKMFYLPEAHTDFIMAVIGEEFGLIGVWGVLIVFVILLRKMFMVARESMAFERNFQALAVQGIAVWIGVQVFINLGVCMGALPTKGLTLPFISYGGSALLLSCVAMAFVLRVDYENRLIQRGEMKKGQG